jgi:hypothetical protein
MSSEEVQVSLPDLYSRSARRHGWRIAAASIVTLLAGCNSTSAENARSADEFVDSIGVNTHSYYRTGPYAKYAWREKLLASGIRYIRENLQRASARQASRINDLHAAGGIRASFIFDPRRDRGGSVPELLGRLKRSMLPATEQVEGPNEYENAPEADWHEAATAAGDYQADLYSMVKGDPATAHLTVLGPSVAHPMGYGAWGNLSEWLDQGNMHSYAGGRIPSADLNEWIVAAQTTSEAKPVQATETGYHNAISTTDEHEPASERAAAIYLPRTYLEYFRRGIKRTFAYELLDEGSSSSDIEDAFGLMRADYTEKPAMVALRNLIDLLEDPGPAFAPGSLNYSLVNAPSDVRQVSLQKRGGSFWLALWREVSVWDQIAREDRYPGRATVTLDLADPVVRAAVYVPNRSTSATRTVVAPTSLTLDIGPAVTLVELIPGAEAGATPEFHSSTDLTGSRHDLLAPRG